MEKRLRELIRNRAGDCCEYCQMPQQFDELRHQIDHVIAEQHRGPTSSENLALACYTCNKHKGPNISSIDPETEARADLFDPRNDQWTDHFNWDGPALTGMTPVGRATVALLKINMPARVALRASLIQEGVFPPAS